MPDHRDGIATVVRPLAAARQSKDDDGPWNARAGQGLEGDDRGTAGHAAVQQRVSQLASDERGAGLLAARRRPIRGHEQADGSAIREPLEILESEARNEHDAKFLCRGGGRTGCHEHHEGRQGERSDHRRKVQSELPHRPEES